VELGEATTVGFMRHGGYDVSTLVGIILDTFLGLQLLLESIKWTVLFIFVSAKFQGPPFEV